MSPQKEVGTGSLASFPWCLPLPLQEAPQETAQPGQAGASPNRLCEQKREAASRGERRKRGQYEAGGEHPGGTDGSPTGRRRPGVRGKDPEWRQQQQKQQREREQETPSCRRERAKPRSGIKTPRIWWTEYRNEYLTEWLTS